MTVSATHVFIIATVVVWAIFDLGEIATGGVGATISRAILTWHWRSES